MWHRDDNFNGTSQSTNASYRVDPSVPTWKTFQQKYQSFSISLAQSRLWYTNIFQPFDSRRQRSDRRWKQINIERKRRDPKISISATVLSFRRWSLCLTFSSNSTWIPLDLQSSGMLRKDIFQKNPEDLNDVIKSNPNNQQQVDSLNNRVRWESKNFQEKRTWMNQHRFSLAPWDSISHPTANLNKKTIALRC